MASRTTPLNAAAKLRRMSKTAHRLRQAGQALRTQAMENAEAALREDRDEGEESPSAQPSPSGWPPPGPTRASACRRNWI